MSDSKKSADKPKAKPFKRDDIAFLLLRLTVGGLMLFHGVNKLQHGVDGIEAMLAAKGLPTALAHGVHVGETLAPILILLGLYTRLAALVVVFTMGMAIFLRFGDQLLSLGAFGAWAPELPALFLLTALTLFFTGGGKYSVRGGRGAWD